MILTNKESSSLNNLVYDKITKLENEQELFRRDYNPKDNNSTEKHKKTILKEYDEKLKYWNGIIEKLNV